MGQVLKNDHRDPFREERAAQHAINERLFELARHNGYDTRTVTRYGEVCWLIPDEMIGIAGFYVAVMS
jgi:hypothetical protein